MAFPRIHRRSHIKWLALSLFCGSVLICASTAPSQQPAAPPAPAAPNTLIDLAAQRYQVATQGYHLATAGHQPGEAPGYEAIDWMRRRVKARLEIAEPKADRVAFLKEYVDLLRAQEDFEDRMVQKHLGAMQTLLRVRYDRLEAESLLLATQLK